MFSDEFYDFRTTSLFFGRSPSQILPGGADAAADGRESPGHGKGGGGGAATGGGDSEPPGRRHKEAAWDGLEDGLMVMEMDVAMNQNPGNLGTLKYSKIAG